MFKPCFFGAIHCKLLVLFFISKWVIFCKSTLSVEILSYFASGLISLPHYLGDSPPWEQLVGEVKGLVLLLECREGVRPRVLLGEPWHRSGKTGISNVLQRTGRSTRQQQVQILPLFALHKLRAVLVLVLDLENYSHGSRSHEHILEGTALRIKKAHTHFSTIHSACNFNYATVCKYCQRNGLTTHQATQLLRHDLPGSKVCRPLP